MLQAWAHRSNIVADLIEMRSLDGCYGGYGFTREVVE